MWQQFKNLISGLEEGEGKTNLLTAFGALQTDNANIILARDKAKEANVSLKQLVDSLKEATGLGDTLTGDTVKELIKSKSKGGDEVDALNTQMTELREKYGTLETTHNEYVTEAKEKAFELAISRSDIFKDVSSDPFLRNAVLGAVKPKLMIGEDGEIYAKGEDGKILNDIVSGKAIKGTELFTSLIEGGQISKSALNPTVGSGAGGKGGEYTPSNKVDFGGDKSAKENAVAQMIAKG